MTDQEMEEMFNFIKKAIAEIIKLHPKKDGKLQDGIGSIKCPKCDSTLHYSISSYNGHIWGKCETNNCLGWME